MTDLLRVVLDDRAIPAIHRDTLCHTIRVRASGPVTIELISRLPVGDPPNWRIDPTVAGRAWARLWVLTQRTGGRTLFLDGNQLVVGDLAELGAADLSGGLAGPIAGSIPFADLGCCLIDDTAADRPATVAALRERSASYFALAEWEPALGALPEGWRGGPDDRLIDWRRIRSRPWYAAAGRGTIVWQRALAEAIAAGAVDPADVRSAALAGRVRPSLLYQIDRDALDRIDLPASIEIADRAYAPPEIALAPERRAWLDSPAARRRNLFRQFFGWTRKDPRLVWAARRDRLPFFGRRT